MRSLVDCLETIFVTVADAVEGAAIDAAPAHVIASLVVALSNGFKKGGHAK